jgi:hypothetical protein
MYLIHFGLNCQFWISLHLVVGIKFETNIVNIYLLDRLMWQDIITISCCTIWWFPSENFFLIFQLPNDQLLILDFSKVWNQLNT